MKFHRENDGSIPSGGAGMHKVLFGMVILSLSLVFAACTTQGSAENAIEAYLDALVSKDVIRAVNVSCLDWEEGAHAEASSFEAVIVRLEDLECGAVSQVDGRAFVGCEGKIVANYGGEDQDILLAGRTYLAVQEDGVWKMCGYDTRTDE
jgi:hypothetical protein